MFASGEDWDTKDAKVVCRELGFNPNYEFSKAMHGKFEGVISKEGLISANCDGTEKRLEECSISVNNNCSSSIAEVICHSKILPDDLIFFHIKLFYFRFSASKLSPMYKIWM